MAESAQSLATSSRLLALPDELLEAIVSFLSPASTIAFGSTCKQCNKITYEPLVWRRHCVQGWRYWQDRSDWLSRLEGPPFRTKWRIMYNERRRIDTEATECFERLLNTQQARLARIEQIAEHGDDVRDLLLRLKDDTPDDAEDVLARRFYATTILGRISRMTAIGKWMRLHRQQMVSLEECLGAFDLFALSARKIDLDDLDRELARLVRCIMEETADFEEMSIRHKVIRVAEWMRDRRLVGNPDIGNYHALRNNFITMALFAEPHTSLPLQSAAIYCAVLRKMGINAKPSNYPEHVHAVIEAPRDMTLDGKAKIPNPDAAPEIMHMDPWRSRDELAESALRRRLSHMGAPEAQFPQFLRAASTLETVQRSARNILTSINDGRHNAVDPDGPQPDAAYYAMLWSLVILGDAAEVPSPQSLKQRRRHCLPYVMNHYQQGFPEDMGIIEKVFAPMFAGESEHAVLMQHLEETRVDDANMPHRSPRDSEVTKKVQFKIGQYFTHKRYQYEGMVIGWDAQCNAEPAWIRQMGVDQLSRGRTQPFYNVVAGDRSNRYVAEENIESNTQQEPSQNIMNMAGKWFKRWDPSTRRFVSNMKEAFPDD